MARAATNRLKVNPPLGNLPALQWALVSQLQVDGEYQRSVESGPSQALIRKIAMHWNWDLCQPLVVSRRSDGALFVIDGQHRWEAAKQRGDINQLPCVVVDYASAADEAASFVQLNKERKPLSKLDVFKAAVASGNEEACAIVAAIADAGLSIAPHENYKSWKPGMVSNIGGIENAWRSLGAYPVRRALVLLERSFRGEVLRYAGSIFPGVAAICASDAGDTSVDLDKLPDLLASRTQTEWRTALLQRRAVDANISFARASAAVLGDAWTDWLAGRGVTRAAAQVEEKQGADPLVHFVPDDSGMSWCDQCEMRVTRAQGQGCKSRFCSLRKAA